MHVGIDYGSKLAGTTVIAYVLDGSTKILQSTKNKDADTFIINELKKVSASKVYLDAPLSLPLAYYGKGDNYFYRACDIELKAMSPMFLGGLTARAMKLKAQLQALNIEVIECYPKALIHYHRDLKDLYLKKNLSGLNTFINQLKTHFPYDLPEIKNWHQIDAMMAWWSGYRDTKNEAVKIGIPEEGLILY